MIPNLNFITIDSSSELLEGLIHDLILTPRIKAINWSKVTKQTPGLKIGYPAQHIASLLTGVEGGRSAARGDDLVDGSEVKGCNRIDQLDRCKDCSNKVLRHEICCGFCGSDSIKRNNDSKWLIAIKSEAELELYTQKIDRIVFIILDYPYFSNDNFDILSIKVYEIWPKNNDSFKRILSQYYYDIYLKHIALNPRKTPAPKNFWPYQYQFYKCKPIKIYECTVCDINSNPKIVTNLYTAPSYDRSKIEPEAVPTKVLTLEELDIVFSSNKDELNNLYSDAVNFWRSLGETQRKQKKNKELLYEKIPELPHYFIDCLDLRNNSNPVSHTKEYARR